MNWIALVTLLAALQCLVFGALVSAARGKFKLAAPATSGNENFERYFRVHHNTVEQLVVFLPSLWLFGLYLNPIWGAILGAIFIVGRLVYAFGYIKDPAKRGAGFGLSALPTMFLLLGAILGVVRSVISGG